jgi:hypothetical protein
LLNPGLFIRNNRVIPAKAGIQMIRKSPCKWGQHVGFGRFAELVLSLDSGLRRNDGLTDYMG